MRIQDVFQHYQNDLKRVETFMESQMRSEIGIIPEIIQHLVGSGGKRFRPLLLLASAELFGCREPSRYAMSTVIEFIHTATLLHDDVIDQAHVRRGKTSANNIWGNAASVLVGDFLYSKAFRLMTDTGSLPIMKLLSVTTNVMSEGEVFQLVRCGDINITEKDYLSIIEQKTSVLISAACAMGAILADAPSAQVEALTRYGLKIGSAFQITDDALDYMADEDAFGKAIGKDLSEGKITLPLIHALQNCSSGEREAIRYVVERREGEESALKGVMNLIHIYDGVNYALGKAHAFVEEGKTALSIFPESTAKAPLICIADYVVERNT